jgi:hypothetical protein
MTTESVSIPLEEYQQLKKKAEIADDLLLQIENSARDIKAGRLKKV